MKKMFFHAKKNGHGSKGGTNIENELFYQEPHEIVIKLSFYIQFTSCICV